MVVANLVMRSLELPIGRSFDPEALPGALGVKVGETNRDLGFGTLVADGIDGNWYEGDDDPVLEAVAWVAVVPLSEVVDALTAEMGTSVTVDGRAEWEVDGKVVSARTQVDSPETTIVVVLAEGAYDEYLGERNDDV